MKLVCVDIDAPLPAIPPPVRGEQWVLLRLHGHPIGMIKAGPDGCTPQELGRVILQSHGEPLTRHLVADSLGEAGSAFDDLSGLSRACLRGRSEPRTSVTVAVCTRNRAGQLQECLLSLGSLDYPPDLLDILVVDNAPADDSTRAVVDRFPGFRYVREPRPGLDWARNRAILESRSEVIAYTDDDVSVDPCWVRAVVAAFAQERDAMCVTGLVVPDEVDTDVQACFERYGGFGRGYERQVFRVDVEGGHSAARRYGGTGRFGTGANMAFRRAFFDRGGLFDAALDVGTPTNGGGDLDMFFRVLKSGDALVYEPAATVRHRHRRDYAGLKAQITNHGIGFYSYLVRNAAAYPDERGAFLRLGAWWLWKWNLRRLLVSFVRAPSIPRDLMIAELKGSFIGLRRYQKARRHAEAIERQYGSPVPLSGGRVKPNSSTREKPRANDWPMALRIVDVRQPLRGLDDVTAYPRTRIIVQDEGVLVAGIDIDNLWHPISEERLRHSIANVAGQALMRRAFERRLKARGAHLDSSVPVSIIIPTCNRPADLRRCLTALQGQVSERRVEIIVVDNRPGSSTTPDVVRDFPGVLLLNESRPGLSYARNTGIAAAGGDILIAIDDDVTVPPGWLERLVAPFGRPEVMAVTGHVLPVELETESQCRFEAYGGLGKGFNGFEVNGAWFRSLKAAVPTWHLGATANAAFRASIFLDPAIGLLDEALGAGMPTGCSEDTYLFYRILKADHVIVYEPEAWVWHRHRTDMAALEHQIYSYSKGHVAYHLTTLLRDGDLRSLVRLGWSLPKVYAKRIYARLLGASDYPVGLIVTEIAGNLAGPWALWKARRIVRRLGPSAPCLTPDQRASRAAAGQGSTHAVQVEGPLTQSSAS